MQQIMTFEDRTGRHRKRHAQKHKPDKLVAHAGGLNGGRMDQINVFPRKGRVSICTGVFPGSQNGIFSKMYRKPLMLPGADDIMGAEVFKLSKYRNKTTGEKL